MFVKNRQAVEKQTSEFLAKTTASAVVERRNEAHLERLLTKSAGEIKQGGEAYVFRSKIIINGALKKPVWFKNRILPYVEAIPTMFSWVPLQKNILVINFQEIQERYYSIVIDF